MADADSLTKTWKVCTKVAQHLEQGARLENLSWRLWHLHNVLVESDNAKSKREFKKLSKSMGDKLDKEKGRAIEELPAPGFKPTPAQEKLRQKAEEKERAREAVQNGTAVPKAHYNYTFSVDPQNATPTPTTPTSERRPSFTKSNSSRKSIQKMTPVSDGNALKFPAVFGDNSFEPAALLYSASSATAAPPRSYADGASQRAAEFGIVRPTFELALDEFLSDHVHSPNSQQDAPAATSADSMAVDNSVTTNMSLSLVDTFENQSISSGSGGTPPTASTDATAFDYPAFYLTSHVTPTTYEGFSPDTLGLSWANPANEGYMDPQALNNATAASTPRSPGPVSPAASLSPPPAPLPSPEIPLASMPGSKGRSTNNSASSSMPPPSSTKIERDGRMGPTPSATPRGTAPVEGKAECSNCGATHTPLWRRGLNDELNCNACGLYCKLHKRPRPKNFRHGQDGGRGSSSSSSRFSGEDGIGPSEPVSCYNCHTTTTPLWRKDDEGKTVCNACGLYSKLHGAARPLSMKSESIRKRARHDGAPASSTTRRASVSSRTTPYAQASTQRQQAARARREPTPPQMPIVASPPRVQAHDVAETYNGVLDAQGHINLDLDLDDVMGLEDGLANLGMGMHGQQNTYHGPYTEQHQQEQQQYDGQTYNSANDYAEQQQGGAYVAQESYASGSQQEQYDVSAWTQQVTTQQQQQQTFPGPYHPDELQAFITVASPGSNKRRRLSMDAYATSGWGAGVPFPQGYMYGHSYHPPLVNGVPESPVMHPPLQLPGGGVQDDTSAAFWDEALWLRQ
ncbi:hypothetical protein EXIGLDRAFT_707952 [Exidia glandulosa HHB12029]|uniref:GATA-type domain-containing protein n=1 Tax=Exidia glandulosa HHB12029 TaxID=1314781 RepID=A0A166NBX0_EXIGL|nr:hypothetical protein EXIGLDRAFT_707952 [Exidia glandulosa HHB12029]